MIRAAELRDVEQIARVHVQSWEETYRGKLPDHAIDAKPREVRVSEWSRWLRAEDTWTFVHEEGGRIDGFASAHRSALEPGFDALLSMLYIVRSAQGKGVARALLARLARTCIAQGVRSMWLLTLRDENPARDFYERLGARLIREQAAPLALGIGVMDVVYGFDDIGRSLAD